MLERLGKDALHDAERLGTASEIRELLDLFDLRGAALEAVAFRYMHTLKRQRGGDGAVRQWPIAAAEAGRVGGDEEHGFGLFAGLAGKARRDDVAVRAAAGDGIGLGAVQPVSALFRGGRGRDRAASAPHAGFGMGEGEAPAAGEQVAEPFVAQVLARGQGEEASGQHRSLGQRLHHHAASQRLENRGYAGGVQAEPAQFLGERRGDQAQFAQQCPVLAGKAARLGQEGATASMVVRIGDEALGERLEHFLVFAEIEIHVALPSVTRM